jgi:hypothetical protein
MRAIRILRLVIAVAVTGAVVAGPAAAASQPSGAKAPGPMTRSASKTGYVVLVNTASGAKAGTDAHVWINLKGARGASGWIQLDRRGANLFEPSQMNPFVVWVKDLGPITGATLWHSSQADTWRLDQISVRPASGRAAFAVMPAQRWLGRGATELRVS